MPESSWLRTSRSSPTLSHRLVQQALVASTALVLLGLYGCGMYGEPISEGTNMLPPTPPQAATAPTLTESLQSQKARETQAYAQRVNEALDQQAKVRAALAAKALQTSPTCPVAVKSSSVADASCPKVSALSVVAKSTNEPVAAASAVTPVEAAKPVAKVEAKVETKVAKVVKVETKAAEKPVGVVTVALDKADKAADAGPSPALIAPPSSGLSAMGAVIALPPPPPAPVAPPAPVVVTPPPAPLPPPEFTFNDLQDLLRKKLAAKPGHVSYALALQLLQLSEPTTRPAGETPAGEDPAIAGLGAVDHRLVTELAGAINNLSASAAASNATILDRAAPVLDTAAKWNAEADLKLPRLVLASRVDSFGVFTPVDVKFEYGKRHTVIIYCEVANFGTKKDENGWYETHLVQQDTMITDDGLLVWRPNPEEVEDRSMNQRKDFYLVKKMTIPDTLPMGKYVLRMNVIDKLTGKTTQSNLNLEIVGK